MTVAKSAGGRVAWDALLETLSEHGKAGNPAENHLTDALSGRTWSGLALGWQEGQTPLFSEGLPTAAGNLLPTGNG